MDGVKASGDAMTHECGVFGIFGHAEAAQLSYYGLYALQHRGQESAGIATVDGHTMHSHRGMGLVTEAFAGDRLKHLPGYAAIGHVRYSTTGRSELKNAQPLVFDFRRGNLALAHNGNFVNAHVLHDQLEQAGSIFQSTSDTEIVAHLIARRTAGSLQDNVVAAFSELRGGYALLILTDDQLIGVRDPLGLRPLALGRLGEAVVLASETCAFDTIGATFVRDVAPGEMIIVDRDGLRSRVLAEPKRSALCTFEYIYFARPDSDIDGYNVHAIRKRLGRLLAQTAPASADVVIGVPDSSISAAIGFAEESSLPYEIGLIKNKYSGRTFIQPSQALRDLGVRLKLSAVRGIVAGKRVVMVDDSIVRGTTSKHLVQLLRDAGATEVHVRIASPPVTHSCFYGIDTSAREELIAATRTVAEIGAFVGSDSLSFLAEETMVEAFEADARTGFCNACFTGRYPTETYAANKHALERGQERPVNV